MDAFHFSGPFPGRGHAFCCHHSDVSRFSLGCIFKKVYMTKILAIDDETFNLTALSALLKTFIPGCGVVTARSGAKGLEIALKERPDTILLDVQMPKIDGFEVCKRLKAEEATKNIPIIMLTGVATQLESRVKGLKYGADAYLTKPVESVELAAHVQALLRIKETRDGLLEEKRIQEGLVSEKSQALKQGAHDLDERVKELNCLYRISELDKHDSPLEEILGGIVNLIPLSWPHPKITCARIALKDHEFRSDNFSDIARKQIRDIIVHGQPVGRLEVGLFQQSPERFARGFTKNKRDILLIIAERLGKIIERKKSEAALRASEERYRVLAENIADGVAIFVEDRFVFVNHAFCSLFGYSQEELINMDPVTLFGKEHEDCFKRLLGILVQGVLVSTFQTRYPDTTNKFFTTTNGNLWIEIHNSFIEWDGMSAILFTARDITRIKIAEMAKEEEATQLRQENVVLKANIRERFKFGNIVGKSSAMQKVYEFIARASSSDASVVIYGESGTGKELVARAIHDNSGRCKEEFVSVNCGAIPESLAESEFFGYKKGAFTGAGIDKAGILDIVDGGTLFLDEVGDLSLNMQVKLLRAIEGGGYIPIGATKTRKSNCRFLAATNKNLADLVERGLTRQDFFYRIQVLSITLPPLRERKDDMGLLIDHFLGLYSDEEAPATIPAHIRTALCNHDWPGNVRELQNVLSRYLTMGCFDLGQTTTCGPRSSGAKPLSLGYRQAMAEFEKDLIKEALNRTRWRRNEAAAALGIGRRTLYRKLRSFGLR